jgi:hypothetical protein
MKSVLTKSQASELLRAASLLSLAARDQFISEVDKHLCSVKRWRLNDVDVNRAITTVLSTLNVTIMCDSAEGA